MFAPNPPGAFYCVGHGVHQIQILLIEVTEYCGDLTTNLSMRSDADEAVARL